MPSTLLFGESYNGEAGTINLSARTPNPGPGAAAEYVGAADRYRVFAAGYADASSATLSIARYPYTVAAGLTFRLCPDVLRESLDAVEGEINFYAYVPATAIGTWDLKDCLLFQIKRTSYNEVSVAAIWVKAAGEFPATEQLAFVASNLHAGNTEHGYAFEVDEVAERVRIYRSDYGDGEDEEPLSEGVLPPELLAHVTADRRIGFATSRALDRVNFQVNNFSVFDMTTAALAGPLCTLLLTVYDNNRVTPLWEVATDPAHPTPFLVEPANYGEQQIDVATGSASLGTVTVTVTDQAQTPGDQDSGYVTGRLAALGLADLAGRRCRLIRFVAEAPGYQVIADGPAGTPRLESDYASYSWEIRDTRETERKVRCFDQVVGTPVTIGSSTTIPPEEES